MATKKIMGVIAALTLMFLCAFGAQANDLPGEGGDESVMNHTIATFPSSTEPHEGLPWVTMHTSGFTGSVQEACTALEVTQEQCEKFDSAHQVGTADVLDVPNGIVLDRLTFTQKGRHKVQKNVLVQLSNPSSRRTEVVEVGNGLYMMRFHGCGNYALVRMPKPAPPEPVPVYHVSPPLPEIPDDTRPPPRYVHRICISGC